MHLHQDRTGYLSVSKQLDPIVLSNESRTFQLIQSHLGVITESLQVLDIDRLVFDAKEIGEASFG
jgi:hypothetical protein